MSEFGDRIRKINGKRNHKVKGAVKIADIYYTLKRSGEIGDIDIKTFRLIVKNMGKNIAQLLWDGYNIRLPHSMGSIAITKKDIVTKFKDGQVIHNRLIDWKSTTDLWESDPNSMQEKKLVYYMNDVKYYARYYKTDARFKNKFFFDFKIHREIMSGIYEYAKKNNITYHKETTT